MIPRLLWQCPLCHSDDALRQRTRWRGSDELVCVACDTAWAVQRVVGHDFLLTVTRGAPATRGEQRPLAEWYDLMKAGLRLIRRHDAALPLRPDEELYVQSRRAELYVEEDNPLVRGWTGEEAPAHKDTGLGMFFVRHWDHGRLGLTSQRFLWVGERQALSFELGRVNSAFAEVHRYFVLLFGLRVYKFRFLDESILKWVTYTGLVARRSDAVDPSRIALSNY